MILVGFLVKGMKSANLGNFGVLHRGVGIPRSSVIPRQGVACPHRGMAEREAWTSLRYATACLRRSVATVHNMEIFVFLFCFVFPLLQGLVYWTNEDPISV